MARKKKAAEFVPEVRQADAYQESLAALASAEERQAGLPEGVVWWGNPALIPFLVAIDELFEDPSNANTHPERSIASIAASYNRFGQQKPLVCDNNLTIRDGNGQLVAARERLGWTHVAVIPSELDGVEMTAYALAVNRTAQHAERDHQALAGQLKALRDTNVPIHDLGWADYELEPLLAADWTPPPVQGEDHDPAGAPDGEEKPRAIDAITMIATKDQWTIIEQAIERVRGQEDQADLAVGRCLELICADFLARP